jgi:hypothetical protein
MLLAPEILVAAASEISTSLDVPSPEIAFDGRRLYNVLDSLASVCVQRAKGESYAVALKPHAIREADGLVTIFIAGNEDVPKDVQLHLYNIWFLLSKIASQCVEFHKLQQPSLDRREPPRPPPTALRQDGTVTDAHELRKLLYAHCREKLTWSIAKRLDKFVRFVKKLEDHYALGLPIFDEQLQPFTGLVKARDHIRAVHSTLRAPGDLDISKLVLGMRMVHQAVHEVLKAPDSIFAIWSFYASGMSPCGRFMLHRVILSSTDYSA